MSIRPSPRQRRSSRRRGPRGDVTGYHLGPSWRSLRTSTTASVAVTSASCAGTRSAGAAPSRCRCSSSCCRALSASRASSRAPRVRECRTATGGLALSRAVPLDIAGGDTLRARDWAAHGLPGSLQQYLALKRYGLNTVEVDVKDETGIVAFIKERPRSRSRTALRAATTTRRPSLLRRTGRAST